MIREATREDVPALVDLCARFHAWSQFPEIGFDPESCERSFSAAVDRDDAVILHGGGGFLVLALVSPLFNQHQRMAMELLFWAPEGNGDALRKAGEAWARPRASLLMMCAHEPSERGAKWYARKGYSAFGRQFMKVI